MSSAPSSPPSAPQILWAVYLSIGSGHRIAAEALAATFRRFFAAQYAVYDLRALDPFSDNLSFLPPVLEYLNLWSRQIFPALYDAFWRNGIPPGLYKRMLELRLLRKIMASALEEQQPAAIIATHALPCALAVEVAPHIPVYGVVTDFGAHPFWPHRGVSAYFVAHEEIRNTFIYRGFPAERVFATGIPLRPDFMEIRQPSSTTHDEPLRVLVLAGGQGLGGYRPLERQILALIRQVLQMPSLEITVTVVTGRNEGLRQRLSEAFSHPSIRILGFVEHMAQLLADHHVVLTKPGGLSVAEALATGTPLLLLRPGVGQERANEEFLARHRAALPAYTPEQALKQVQHLAANRALRSTLQRNALRLGRPDASRRILETLLSSLR